MKGIGYHEARVTLFKALQDAGPLTNVKRETAQTEAFGLLEMFLGGPFLFLQNIYINDHFNYKSNCLLVFCVLKIAFLYRKVLENVF